MSNNRGKKLALNTITSLSLQVVTVICGFILPRLILGTFGSDVNGLVNSITQFLGVITLLDLGVGAVVQSSLYKPLAENDKDSISKIYVSANRFFKRLATILVVYVSVLVFVYPLIVNKKFGFLFTAALIGAISINTFSQYYFGIVNSLLLSADQKGYIQYTAQIVVLVINTISCAVLIKIGASIQIVKLTTSIIFLFRPLYLFFYVRSHYDIDKKIKYTEEPIKQKWNGMAQHFASYILGGTDNIVLTLFSTLSNVSIYSVYNLFINGIFMLITSLSNGFFSFFGDMWAKNEKEALRKTFILFEWITNMFSIWVFGSASMVILDFVRTYTSGVEDANYIQPCFALILVVAYFARSLRMPYNFIILAAGHYKQTQSSYIISMIMNIVISVLFVKFFGLVGVAIGTFVAMLYQTLWMAWYNYKYLINLEGKRFAKLMFVDIFIVICGIIVGFNVKLPVNGYLSLFFKAIIIAVVWLIILALFNIVFYRSEVKQLLYFIKRKVKRI
ncbi:Membrane protein involved in the export of O-antigen and teichoic acid [Ruminococcus sp. YRD2003]|uniref:oligosaccharide flippase family protein n=1 Tax=Ruminococcus sp. YRD2003 TaxID=1452313 RepID=UPI0008B9EF7F|nr:Membrane protein involved in the export of O-antigen and teichoic acid [Ruminococcus flavefaciens]